VVFAAAVDAAAGAGLLAVCRRYGMRLIGPNCFGIAVPSIGLDATFAAANPAPGTAGLVMQSGGLGFAMVDHLTRLGIGISSFASVGNKLDVSSNDMLMWWEQDGQTRVAVLYIESFGNPRKFARTARRVGARMPVITVHAGRSEAGQRAAATHTSSATTPLVTREALFEQAGIIATPSFGELMGATALLATQPPPAGRTVAIVSNVGGAGVLDQLEAEGGGAEPARPRGAAQRLKPGRIQCIGDAVYHPLDPFQVVDRQSRVEVMHPRRGLVTVVVDHKNGQAGGARRPGELPYPRVGLGPGGQEQGGQPGPAELGEAGRHDHVVTVTGDHDEPAFGEHAEAARDALGEHRHLLDAPGQVTLAKHPRAPLTNQIADTQPGQLRAVRHRGDEAEPALG